MLFSVHPGDGLPIYLQLVRQISHAVASGSLQPGQKMPSQRDLAAELVISHLTVKKAYEVLESRGILLTLRGRGTFVARNIPPALRGQGLEQLQTQLRQFSDSARLLGLTREEYLDMLKTAWKEPDPS